MNKKLHDLLITVLNEVNTGNMIDSKKLDKMWTLLHVMHFASFSNDSKVAYKILDYYG